MQVRAGFGTRLGVMKETVVTETVVAVLVIAGASVSACGSPSDVVPCGRIPDEGCPIGRGGTCDDAACEGLYDCVEGAWMLVEDCGRTVGEGGAGAGAGAGSAGGCAPAATIDRAEEADGCLPALQSPDCPVDAAEVCEPCLTGCADFYLCESLGWEFVAFCDEEGQLVVVQGAP
jgi:hypothetical protein